MSNVKSKTNDSNRNSSCVIDWRIQVQYRRQVLRLKQNNYGRSSNQIIESRSTQPKTVLPIRLRRRKHSEQHTFRRRARSSPMCETRTHRLHQNIKLTWKVAHDTNLVHFNMNAKHKWKQKWKRLITSESFTMTKHLTTFQPSADGILNRLKTT